MFLQLLWEGIKPSWWFLDKHDTPMFRYSFMACRLHVHNVFDEMFDMVRHG